MPHVCSPALRRPRQENYRFEARLSYIVKSWQREQELRMWVSSRALGYMSIALGSIPNSHRKCKIREGVGEGQKEGGKERGVRVRGRSDKLLGIKLFLHLISRETFTFDLPLCSLCSSHPSQVVSPIAPPKCHCNESTVTDGLLGTRI